MAFPVVPVHTFSEVLDDAVRVVAAVQVAMVTGSVPPGGSIVLSTRSRAVRVVVSVFRAEFHSEMPAQ